MQGDVYYWTEPVIRDNRLALGILQPTSSSVAALKSADPRRGSIAASEIGRHLNQVIPPDVDREVNGLLVDTTISLGAKGAQLALHLKQAALGPASVEPDGIHIRVLLEGKAELALGDTLTSAITPKTPRAVIWENTNFQGQSLEIFEDQPLLPWPFTLGPNFAEASSIQTNLDEGEWAVFWEEAGYDRGSDQLWVQGTQSLPNLHLKEGKLRRLHGNNEWGDRIRGVSFPNGGPTGSNENRTVLSRQ